MEIIHDKKGREKHRYRFYNDTWSLYPVRNRLDRAMNLVLMGLMAMSVLLFYIADCLIIWIFFSPSLPHPFSSLEAFAVLVYFFGSTVFMTVGGIVSSRSAWEEEKLFGRNFPFRSKS